jgi:deoxyribodipyrimidine photolyase-related protein
MPTRLLKSDTRSRNEVTLILGNQLFHDFYDSGPFLMMEDPGIATHYHYHKLRILHQFICMREFRDHLIDHGHEVSYLEYPDSLRLGENSFFERLSLLTNTHDFKTIRTARIPDTSFRDQLIAWGEAAQVNIVFIPSPQFLVSDDYFSKYLNKYKKPFMKNFYEGVRKDYKILLDKNNGPEGGQWSFDSDNRKKLPKSIDIPTLPYYEISKHQADVHSLVEEHFAKHPGNLPAVDADLWIPTKRKDALLFLNAFLLERFSHFGPYEDSITNDSDFVFHSALSPLINIGILSPTEVIQAAIAHARLQKVPIESLEGFVRQIIGWREFIHGIHQNFHEEQIRENFFNHKRLMKSCWYEGTTGLPPVDDAIKKANRLGYNHHIERLMILSNCMLLTEIDPSAVHRWFMEMFLDSYEWVMGPNVYGMAQFSDGGIFATKPYISGSNYILKMSHYSKGDWCDIWDGLYWSFIDRNLTFFQKNPRLSMMPRQLLKMDPGRKARIFSLAQNFRDKVSTMG